jgi:hypothetical protein
MQFLILQDEGGGIAVGIGAFVLVIWAVVILASFFWIWMLNDAQVNEPTTNEKIFGSW